MNEYIMDRACCVPLNIILKENVINENVGEDCQLRNGFVFYILFCFYLLEFSFQNVRSNTNFSTFIGIGVWNRA